MSNQVTVVKVKFQLGEKSYEVNSLASDYGLLMVFDERSAPTEINDFLGRPVTFSVDSLKVQGFFVKEVQSQSVYYGVRFDADSESHQQLTKMVAEKGAPMPPRRKFPRLEFQTNVDLPLPQYIHVLSDETPYFFSILNFTVGGLLIESFSHISKSLEVGQKIRFTMFITDNSQIDEVSAVVVRSQESVSEELLGENFVQYGLQIVDMSQKGHEKFRKIIYDYCLYLQKAS